MLFIEINCSISTLVAVVVAADTAAVISSSFHCGLSYLTHISTKPTPNLNYSEHLFMKKPINLNIYIVWQINQNLLCWLSKTPYTTDTHMCFTYVWQTMYVHVVSNEFHTHTHALFMCWMIWVQYLINFKLEFLAAKIVHIYSSLWFSITIQTKLLCFKH